MTNVVQFPISQLHRSSFETDLDFVLAIIEVIMEETEYTELTVIALTEDNEIEAGHTESNARTIEILDRAIEEQFIGE